MLQIRTAQYILYLSNILSTHDFEDECGYFYIKTWNLNTIYESFVFSLDLKLGFSLLFKVYLNQAWIHILGNFTTLIKNAKHISHLHNHEIIIINSPQALQRLLDCTQRASLYETDKWELLSQTKSIFETKIVVYNTRLLYRICISVNKGGIFRFSSTRIAQMQHFTGDGFLWVL